MTGRFYVSRNICDFTCFKSPNMFYIESKATWSDRFDFSMLSDTQYYGLLKKSEIKNCFGVVIVLFATHKRAFCIDIRDINDLEHRAVNDINLNFDGKRIKSLNINKLDKWSVPYNEIQTVPSRKLLLDYQGEIEKSLIVNRNS